MVFSGVCFQRSVEGNGNELLRIRQLLMVEMCLNIG